MTEQTDWTAYTAPALKDFLGSFQDALDVFAVAQAGYVNVYVLADREVHDAIDAGDINDHLEAIISEIRGHIMQIEDAMKATPESRTEARQDRDAQNIDGVV